MGRRVGLVTDERYDMFVKKREAIEKEVKRLSATNISPEQANGMLASKGLQELSVPIKADKLFDEAGHKL